MRKFCVRFRETGQLWTAPGTAESIRLFETPRRAIQAVGRSYHDDLFDVLPVTIGDDETVVLGEKPVTLPTRTAVEDAWSDIARRSCGGIREMTKLDREDIIRQTGITEAMFRTMTKVLDKGGPAVAFKPWWLLTSRATIN